MPERKTTSEDGGFAPSEKVHAFVDWCALKLKWALAPSAAIFGILSTVLGIIVSSTWPVMESTGQAAPPGARECWLIFFIVLTAAVSISFTALIDVSRRGQEKGQISARASSQLALREAVLPSLRTAAKMASSPSGMHFQHLAKIVSDTLKSAPVIFNTKSNMRMIIYKEEQREGLTVLTPLDETGRVIDEPTEFFSNDNGRGSVIFEWLRKPKPPTIFVPDINDPEYSGKYSKAVEEDTGYRTFISTAIIANGTSLGMLTVDAPNPGDLDDTHIPILEVLAKILATAFALHAKGA